MTIKSPLSERPWNDAAGRRQFPPCLPRLLARAAAAALLLATLSASGTAGWTAPERDGAPGLAGSSAGQQAVQSPSAATSDGLARPQAALTVYAMNDSPTYLGRATSFAADAPECWDLYPASYIWLFGDGAVGSGQAITHTYPALGTYTATVQASCYFIIWGWQTGEAQTVVAIIDEPLAGLVAENSSPTIPGDYTYLTATVSAGSSVTYAWQLGDGTTSEGQFVNHIYPGLGTYTAVVTATNQAGAAVAGTTVIIGYRFIAGLTAGNDGPTVLGSATTLTASVAAGYSTTYAWSFGDGALGAGSPVTHTYEAAGQYTAVVTATNPASQAVTTTRVTVDQALANLTARSSGATALGSATAFTATISAGTNVAYTWAFGDGTSSGGVSASHTYATIGLFTATVTATNSVSVLTATTAVRVDNAVAGLTAHNSGPTSLRFPTILTATTTAGNDVSFSWDLGDGARATESHVSHVYSDIGWYRAVVTASNSASLMTATTTVWVQSVADLYLTKEMGPDPVLAGSAITVSVTITSIGPFTATAVTLTDPLPPGVDFGGIVAGGGTYDAGLNAVSWVGDLSSPPLQPTSLFTVPFVWNDIRGMGQAVDWGVDDDENTVAVALPWDFPFFGDYSRTLYVGSNGNVGFSASAGGLYNGNGSLPSPAQPNNRIAAFYADLVGPIEALNTFGVTLPGAVYTYADATSSRFVVQYTDWADWNSCNSTCLLNTFQIVLHQSGPIAVYYATAQAAPPSLYVGPSQVRTPTGVGMESAAGDSALVWPGRVAAGTGWMYRPAIAQTVAYTAVVRPEVAAWTVLSSTAVLTASSVDGDLADNSATASVRVDKAELAVTKSAWPNTMTGSEPLTYTVMVTNTGTFTLHVTITDVLPAEVAPTGTLTWTTVLPSPWGTWSTTLSVLPHQRYHGTLSNLITVSSSEGATGTARADVIVVNYSAYLPVVIRGAGP